MINILRCVWRWWCGASKKPKKISSKQFFELESERDGEWEKCVCLYVCVSACKCVYRCGFCLRVWITKLTKQGQDLSFTNHTHAHTLDMSSPHTHTLSHTHKRKRFFEASCKLTDNTFNRPSSSFLSSNLFLT